MSKPLLNVDLDLVAGVYRTSKSDEVCRNLLLYFAGQIGPRTLELVQMLCPDVISESESRVLDEIITLEVYTDQEIEGAADAALQDTGNLFGSFLLVLFWGK